MHLPVITPLPLEVISRPPVLLVACDCKGDSLICCATACTVVVPGGFVAALIIVVFPLPDVPTGEICISATRTAPPPLVACAIALSKAVNAMRFVVTDVVGVGVVAGAAFVFSPDDATLDDFFTLCVSILFFVTFCEKHTPSFTLEECLINVFRLYVRFNVCCCCCRQCQVNIFL